MLGKGRELESQLKSQKGVSQEQIYALLSFIKTTVTSLKSQMRHLDSSMKYSRMKMEEFSIYHLLENEERGYYSEKLSEKDTSLIINKKIDFVHQT